MKNLKTILSIVFFVGTFSLLLVSCGNKKCEKQCCQTEACKKHCVDSKCCEEGKTCDINGHDDCKHKCCNDNGEPCHVEGEKSCCKTK